MNGDANINELRSGGIEGAESGARPAAAGYCRLCGKALTAETARQIGGVIYCAEHAPVQQAPPPPPPPQPPYAGYTPPQSAGVSPGLAFVLGLIPGVGAIYNSQYAKGLLHVIIFGLLISILESGAGPEPLFGILLAGFYFYMAFEAYHTAKKRQLGEPVDEFSSLIPLKNGTGTLVGPVVLIAAGILFLLGNLNLIEFRVLVRYWPVLLIVLGAYLLWARVRGGNPPAEVDNERR